MQMTTALFWVITQRGVLIPYRRFGTTYRSRLQRSRIQIVVPKRPQEGTTTCCVKAQFSWSSSLCIFLQSPFTSCLSGWSTSCSSLFSGTLTRCVLLSDITSKFQTVAMYVTLIFRRSHLYDISQYRIPFLSLQTFILDRQQSAGSLCAAAMLTFHLPILLYQVPSISH